MAMAEVLLL